MTVRLDSWIAQTEQLHSLTRDSLERLQLGKLCDILAREHLRNGFYRHLPHSVDSLEQLQKLPFTTQDDLRNHHSEILLAPKSKVARIISDNTSGTSGNIKRVYYSEQDLTNTIGFFTAGLGELVFPGEKVLIAMPFSGTDGLGDLISAAIEALGATPIKAGINRTYSELIDLCEKERPRAFVGMPIPLLSLLRLYENCSISRAVVSADTLPFSVQKALSLYLQDGLFPHYGSRESGLGGAFTCKAHSGMHLRENHIIAEIIDSHGNRAADGTEGELVITTIGMEVFPLIRYKTGDRARIVPGTCPCGSVTKRLQNTRRLTKGADIAQFDDILFELDTLIDYQSSVNNNTLSISAATLDGCGKEWIEQRLSCVMGDTEISVTVTETQLSDKPKYPGKRIISHPQIL